MKLARKSVPFIIAVALLAACLLAVGLSPLVLPDYKGTIEEREQPQNFNLLYLNSGEELNLYPWNLYTGRGAGAFRGGDSQLCGKQRADFGRRLLDR